MSRRVFKPTAEQRGCVEAMIGYGIPQAEICLLIKNPETSEPIDLETLRKHFATEIATGATKLKLLVGNRIVASILGRDGGLQSDQARARLAVFFAKARMGWKDTAANGREHVGGPIEYRDAKDVPQRISDKIDRLARSLRAGETGRSCEG